MLSMKNILLFLLMSTTVVFSSQNHTEIAKTKIQGRLNIINGASAECVMHRFYTNSGWTQIKGEIGRNGIDGLYYKKKHDVIREVLVAESKWNSSQLGFSGKGNTVKQMSKEWVLRTMDRLVKKMDTHTYRTLRKLIQHDQYRARLFRLKPVGKESIQITIYRIKNKGYKAFDEIRDTQLKPININAPKSRFEEDMVRAYNDCRETYLHKYLPALSDRKIKYLLRDNYIQAEDISGTIKEKKAESERHTRRNKQPGI